jgi:hypothetical protein
MKPRWLVAIVWLAFVLRGVYYCAELPMWEGLDEWAHFAALQYFAEHGHMPARTDLVSDEVVRSLELAPLPWSNNGWVAGAVNHDEFWQLPAEERARRREELGRLTAGYRRSTDLPPAVQRQYEGQQPPLYYATLAVPYLISRNWPLPRQVLLLRVLTLLMASATIPLAYGIARRTAAARGAAVAVIVFLAAMPALVLFVAHIGNDSLGLPLMTLVVWMFLKTPLPYGRGSKWRLIWSRDRRGAEPSRLRSYLLPALALALAMLTKGYAIILLPLFALRNRKALALALILAGWWYAANLAETGTLAGDQMDVASHARLTDKLAAIPHINWLRVLDSGAMTHIWIGGWSFLQLRSWMYRVWEMIALAGLIGVALIAKRIPWLIAAQALFVLATAYFSINAFLAMHISAGVGWYLIAMSAVEATLLACGFAGLLGLPRARIAMAATALLALALDVYTVHFVLVPYYTGLIRHRPNGALEAFHLNGFPSISPLHLAGTAALAAVILWSFRSPLPAPARHSIPGSPVR